MGYLKPPWFQGELHLCPSRSPGSSSNSRVTYTSLCKNKKHDQQATTVLNYEVRSEKLAIKCNNKLLFHANSRK